MTTRALPKRSKQPFPSQGVVHDLSGFPVDATGWVWNLNHPVSRRRRLDFRKLGIRSPALLESVAAFMAERVQITSVDDARNAFEALCHLHLSSHFAAADDRGDMLEEAFFSDLRVIKQLAVWRLHHVRMWYRWCADRHLRQFSRDVAEKLDNLRIGGNEKGRAVRTQDPLQGAFDQLEFIALTTRLRSLETSRTLNLQERVLLWLSIACGCNPLAYALLREEDHKPLLERGTEKTYHRFDVPRIKKGAEDFRNAFHPVMLNAEIGGWVAKLIEENRKRRAIDGWPDGCAHAFFVRSAPRKELLGGPRHEYAMHVAPEEIAAMLKRAVDKLGVISHRTGKPLHVNPRRFRRTFATRAVEEGASPVELAVLLDHTDLQNVGVYFETRSSQVARLDAALATVLGPIADAFMGRLVGSEADAVNGDDPAKRIPWFRRVPGRAPERAGNLGTCGSGPCSLFAPVSCYTCDKFQPWRDGPHREMLDWLCAERERKEKEGLDPQIVQIHDATIFAVAEVVRRCEDGAP